MLHVIEINPSVFLALVQAAILDGFRVENTNAGFPMLASHLKEINLFPAVEGQDYAFPYSDVDGTVVVNEYGQMEFMLSVQAAILDGYRIDQDSVYFDGPRVVKLKKEVDVKPEPVAESAPVEKPVKTPRKKAAK